MYKYVGHAQKSRHGTMNTIGLAYQQHPFWTLSSRLIFLWFVSGAGDKPGCGIRDSFGASQLLDRSLCRKLLLYARR